MTTFQESLTAYEFYARVSRKEFTNNSKFYNFDFPVNFGRILKLTGQKEEEKLDYFLKTIVKILCYDYKQKIPKLEVVLLTSSKSFSIQYLVGLIECVLNSLGVESIENATKECLKRIHIFKCDNVEQLLASLMNLKKFLFDNQNVQFLMQNIDFFSWKKVGENRNKKYNNKINELLKDLTKNYKLNSVVLIPHLEKDDFIFDVQSDNDNFELVFK